MKKDFLLEIGTEEIPASFLVSAEMQLRERMIGFLRDKKISYGEITSFSTPRRLSLFIRELTAKQEGREIEILGPSKKASSMDINGFAKAHGVSASRLTLKETKRGEVYCYLKRESGKTSVELLKDFLPDLIQRMEFSRAMWWEASKIRFARPIRWILVLYGENPILIKVCGIQSSRKSFGHRFLHPKPFLLKKPNQYVKTLEKYGVFVDRKTRKEKILAEIDSKTKRVKGKALLDTDLVEEVTDLVEYPFAVLGKFESKFIKLPKDVIITAMKSHQRYFAVVNNQGNLLPYFIAIANIKNQSMDAIRKGNESVLSARLEDASYYWEEDKKKGISEMAEGLKGVVWQENLGTLYEKTQRVKWVAGEIASKLNGIDQEVLNRAAYLSKADLLSSMIRGGKEFTQLEGVMGREYALASGESQKVADSIYEHTLPRFSGDDLPQSLEGSLLSIVDKMDTIVGCFINRKIPTGSEDPYGLRKLGNAIVEILTEREIHLSFKSFSKTVLDGYYRMEFPDSNLPEDIFVHSLSVKLGSSISEFETIQFREDFLYFFEQRVRGYLLARGETSF
jgi:glycyl-tRNA synthetase beta chain